MHMLTQFLSTMTTIRYANSPDEMIREQYKSLTRLVPVLYLVCLFACIAIVVAFSNGAPAWLGRWIPLSLGVVMLVRHRYWVSRRGTEETADIAAIRRDMRGTEFLGPALATGFSIYSVAMLGYASNEFEESLLVVTVWITAIASAFCLAVLPLASTLVVAGAALPLILAFGTSGNPQMMVLAGLFTDRLGR
jgi:predicted signal transduction protein with EAL and GGDEF domain